MTGPSSACVSRSVDAADKGSAAKRRKSNKGAAGEEIYFCFSFFLVLLVVTCSNL
ncbi:unnamed protein product [Ectocarpus sp. CCAP 1310/34]|nr:unnamed protein product [Ectocarpus sp. CCAP 1310/34]